ncbi:type II secretion system protein M [Motilimonas sp. 1_MG-2023]|uniref:type II secretion system protein M n=1 Tax=Motilimonas sp. 1_MG-2023 TaxID=3062672 RepID=UPI0026E435F9|nr:type II secretion system protein M [Motilimonas sp. 1_MG-2023]MDO6527362.1 type II secretion system protein M [Motilimonas sp. 1_MG-2023]
MKEWWENLATRERNLAILSAVVLIVGAFYWGLYQPLSNALANEQTRLKSNQQTLVWMKSKGQDIVNFQAHNASQVGKVNLNQLIGNSARQSGITISRIQPKGDELEVWIDNIEFNKLLSWLKQLKERHGVVTLNTDLAVGDAPGRVKVRRLHLGVAG